jgi:hypothetical protein
MTVLHIVLTVLDWLCTPFGRASASIADARAHPRSIWADSGVIWVEPPLDPSFRVLRVRHAGGVGPPEHTYPPQDRPAAPSPAPSTLIWVCPDLDPSFKVHRVRHIGEEVVAKKFEFSDSESEEEPAPPRQTSWEPWQRVSQPNAIRSRGPRPHGPRAIGEAWSPLVEGR